MEPTHTLSSEKKHLDTQSTVRSHPKPNLPPVSSAILDDAVGRRTMPRTAVDNFDHLPEGIHTPMRGQDNIQHSRSPLLDLKSTLPVNRLVCRIV
jgi:hypothetical protein